ncbi:hypothetical protein ABZ897_60415 [Nonomuraea sp. NPDC046802]|uniref:hypothetical protein n=1 Tax=Nonomuraea sp. NPDC046802 TaxID=3154919 RepID=UPI0033F061F8
MRMLVFALVIVLIITSVAPIWMAARWIIRRRRDQKDLARCQALIQHLHDRAQKHQELGDHFAVIVTDDIRNFTVNNTLPEGLEP